MFDDIFKGGGAPVASALSQEPGGRNYAKRSTWMLLIIIVTVGILGRLTYPASYNDWIDRDIQRTIGLVRGEHLPLVGPELNSGGFLPGPFLYVLLSPVYFLTDSPYAAVYFNGVLNIASILFFFLIIRKRYSFFCVLVAVGLLSFSVMHAWSFGSPINPSLIFVFNALILWLFLKIFVDGADWYFAPALITISLVSQIHLSFAIYTVSLLVLSLFVQRPRGRVVVVSLVCALLTLVPYGFYRYQTSGIVLHRSYQQFSVSGRLYEILPLQTFLKIFGYPHAPSLDIVRERLSNVVANIIPGVGWHLSREILSLYRWSVSLIELVAFTLAIIVGAGTVLVWGYKSRFRFSTTQRKLVVPFLATFPIVLVWQWAGFSRHGHDWYSFIFFPLVPLWIAVSLEVVQGWGRAAWQKTFGVVVLVMLVLLAPKVIMYNKTVFFLLNDIVQDIREVKHQLHLPLECFRKDVFFVDRPGGTDPPFRALPWGTYTDYMYGSVASDVDIEQKDCRQCYFVGHKRFTDLYSLDHYRENIEGLFGLRPDRIFSSDRLVFFEYKRPTHGNCFHNTSNAWVISERINYTMAKIPRDRQTMILEDEVLVDHSGDMARRQLDFAIIDHTAMLRMSAQISFEREPEGYAWRATLDSPDLMGHLNTWEAYSGLYRPWPQLWLDDVQLILEGKNVNETIRFADGEIGKYMFTPLTAGPVHLDVGLEDKILTLSLRYKAMVVGRYSGDGFDIQQLVGDKDEARSWETTHVLYQGRLRKAE